MSTPRTPQTPHRPPARWAVAGLAAASVVVAAVAPSAVSAARSWTGAEERPSVSIGVADGSAEQRVLGEIYRQMFLSLGRGADVVGVGDSPGNAVDALREEGVQFTFTCTGTLLTQLNRMGAEELASELGEENPGVAEPAGVTATYEAAVGVLPGGVTTVDPAPAQGCAEAGGTGSGLPRSVIPLFGKVSLLKFKKIF